MHRVLLFAAAVLCAAGAQPLQKEFLGRWQLDEAHTKMIHPGDNPAEMRWRIYESDGARVRVSWGGDQGQGGSYSAKCDGSIESADPGKIRCRQTGPRTIDGEQLDIPDPNHRYYRRAVSTDGTELTITWFADRHRRQPTDRVVYRRVDAPPGGAAGFDGIANDVPASAFHGSTLTLRQMADACVYFGGDSTGSTDTRPGQ